VSPATFYSSSILVVRPKADEKRFDDERENEDKGDTKKCIRGSEIA